MALQALAEYAILSYAGSVNLTVSLASTNLDYQETFELHRANQKLLQTAAVCLPGPGVGGLSPLPACPPLCVCGGRHGVLSLSDPQPPHGAVRECQGRRLLPDAGEAAGTSGVPWGTWNLGAPRGAGWGLQAQRWARLSGADVCG